jgi:hypothetical protein
MFDIPHFLQSQDINVCIKILLICFHGGYMWVDRLVFIDTDLKVCIIVLPS